MSRARCSSYRWRTRALVEQDPALADLILRAYLVRRSILIELGTGFRIVGSRYSPDTRRLREFAARNRLPHKWIDLEEDKDAESLLRSLGIGPNETPVVIWGGQRVLRNPSNAELARVTGLPVPSAAETVADLIVVGGGPAGLAAAVYGASEGLATVTLDAIATGGQAATSSRIENYLGFPAGVSGSELAERAVIQAEKFGARISVPAEASGLEQHDGEYVVRLDDGTALTGRTVLISTGARYRKLAVPRLERFEGRSIYYAATEIEAQMCAGDRVAIVGGGNSAGQAAMFLAPRVVQVRLLIRDSDLGKSMSRYLVDRIERDPTVEVLRNSEVRVGRRRRPRGARRRGESRRGTALRLYRRRATCAVARRPPRPRRPWLHPHRNPGDPGVQGDAGPAGDPGADRFLLETTLPGVFAAGDVRSGSIKRVASAVGEGAMTVRFVHEHLGGVRERSRG